MTSEPIYRNARADIQRHKSRYRAVSINMQGHQNPYTEPIHRAIRTDIQGHQNRYTGPVPSEPIFGAVRTHIQSRYTGPLQPIYRDITDIQSRYTGPSEPIYRASAIRANIQGRQNQYTERIYRADIQGRHNRYVEPSLRCRAIVADKRSRYHRIVALGERKSQSTHWLDLRKILSC